MKAEKQDTIVGEKWQLYLPATFIAKFAGENEAIVAITENGCVGIFHHSNWRRAFAGFKVAIRRCRYQTRITIPREVRDAMSFFYGATITLVSKRGFVEIQPRPSWSKRMPGRPSLKHPLRPMA